MNKSKLLLATATAILLSLTARAETFRLAAYNVENYLDQPTETRRNIKSDAAKAKVREVILAMKPDVIAFEEMGSLSALLELRDSLKKEGLDLPHYEHVTGFDTNIHVCLLSKFPIVARRSHTNANFLLNGKRFQVSRGFSEVDIKVNDQYQFTLLGAHLKSRRQIAVAPTKPNSATKKPKSSAASWTNISPKTRTPTSSSSATSTTTTTPKVSRKSSVPVKPNSWTPAPPNRTATTSPIPPTPATLRATKPGRTITAWKIPTRALITSCSVPAWPRNG
jgi:hypothetical protein